MPALSSLCSIVGKRADSRTVQNKLTDIVANANRGDYRVRVGACSCIGVDASRPHRLQKFFASKQWQLGASHVRCPWRAA